jgi:hypothetical protein
MFACLIQNIAYIQSRRCVNLGTCIIKNLKYITLSYGIRFYVHVESYNLKTVLSFLRKIGIIIFLYSLQQILGVSLDLKVLFSQKDLHRGRCFM